MSFNNLQKNKNFLRISTLFGVFLLTGLGFINLYLAILPLVIVFFLYAFFNQRFLIYTLFFTMFINGYLRWQTGCSQGIALFVDILVLILYLKLLFDTIMLNKASFLIKSALSAPLILYLLYCLLRLFAPDLPLQAGIGALRIQLFYMPLYFVGYFYALDKKEYKRFMLFCFVMLLFVCLYACKQYFMGLTPREDIWLQAQYASKFVGTDIKIFSLQPKSQDLVMLLAFFIPLFFPLIFVGKKTQYRLLSGVMFFMLISWLTFIRGPIIAWIIAVFVEMIFMLKNHFVNRSQVFRLFAAILALCVAMVFLSNYVTINQKNFSSIIVRIKSIGALPSLVSVTQQSTRMRDEMNSMYARLDIWRETLAGVQNTILGDGLGVLRKRQAELLIYPTTSDIIDNYFIKIYKEVGLFGLILFLNIFFSWILYSRSQKIESIIPIGVTIAVLISCLTGDYLDGLPLRVSLWFFMGLFVRYDHDTMNDREKNER